MTDFDRDDATAPQDEPAAPTPPTEPPPASSTPPASAPPGTTPPAASAPPTPPTPAAPRHDGGMSAQDQRNWAAGAHLSALLLAFFGGLAVLGPLVVYVLKKDDDPFVAEHSREALNFQLTWLVGGFVLGVVGMVVVLLTIGLALFLLVPLGIGLFVAWIVFTVKGGMAASRGEYYRYPLTARVVS